MALTPKHNVSYGRRTLVVNKVLNDSPTYVSCSVNKIPACDGKKKIPVHKHCRLWWCLSVVNSNTSIIRLLYFM